MSDSQKEIVRYNILSDLAQIDEILSEMGEERVIDRMSFEARRENVTAELARLEASDE